MDYSGKVEIAIDPKYRYIIYNIWYIHTYILVDVSARFLFFYIKIFVIESR